ncbi:MAG TPA: hypothetical protein ENF73_03725, partial [Proteobacteria bacterium]|nr:hypothetical protein [Pseudomonadota bacterium]
MRTKALVPVAAALCMAIAGCAKTVSVDPAKFEELQKRQTELEASQARVLRELDRMRSDLLVLEEAVRKR